jgi:hypothetical protein
VILSRRVFALLGSQFKVSYTHRDAPRLDDKTRINILDSSVVDEPTLDLVGWLDSTKSDVISRIANGI